MNIIHNTDTGNLIVDDKIISKEPSVSTDIIKLLNDLLVRLRLNERITFTVITNNSTISKEIYL